MGDQGASPSALTFARLLGGGPLAKVALQAALATVEGEAFIASESGTPIEANQRGRKRQEGAGEGLRAKLRDAIAARDDITADARPFVVPLRCEGRQTFYLVVYRSPSSLEENVALAAGLWELTPKQAEVLRLVADGFSNKIIASRLGCAERTVEAHLTAIFEKSALDSRTALVAAVARF